MNDFLRLITLPYSTYKWLSKTPQNVLFVTKRESDLKKMQSYSHAASLTVNLDRAAFF